VRCAGVIRTVRALYRYEEAAWWLTGDSKAKADDGVEWVRALALDLKVPRLGNFGIQQNAHR